MFTFSLGECINKIYIVKKHTLFITPYIKRGVLLKYPLNNEITVEEVNSYFVELANTFSNQKGKNNGFKVVR